MLCCGGAGGRQAAQECQQCLLCASCPAPQLRAPSQRDAAGQPQPPAAPGGSPGVFSLPGIPAARQGASVHGFILHGAKTQRGGSPKAAPSAAVRTSRESPRLPKNRHQKLRKILEGCVHSTRFKHITCQKKSLFYPNLHPLSYELSRPGVRLPPSAHEDCFGLFCFETFGFISAPRAVPVLLPRCRAV